MKGSPVNFCLQVREPMKTTNWAHASINFLLMKPPFFTCTWESIVEDSDAWTVYVDGTDSQFRESLPLRQSQSGGTSALWVVELLKKTIINQTGSLCVRRLLTRDV